MSKPRFDIEVEERDEAALVTLHGELDMARVDEVEAELGRVEATRPARLVLDLRSLTFLDSSGLRVVVMAGNRARRDGLSLTVVRGPEQVHHVFEITGMDRQLPIVDDPADPPPELVGDEA
jgi:anti-sigma B factor antagonist